MSAPRKRAAIRKAEYEIARLQQKIMLLEYQYSVLKSLAEVVALAEREACAKVCEDYGDKVLDDSGLTNSCARLIRAMGAATTAAGEQR